ncbi:MAG: hypothetical protein QOK42_1236 [Frankiaceae bacterium]|jgi:hypothetical protein|nr:hypothetical protein [Frankiaceae bacterium]MDX6224220.1 hypothetical protein [Frankiales bacterium]MDX6275074.1 hypothetical protein [Frankiales bacterium]
MCGAKVGGPELSAADLATATVIQGKVVFEGEPVAGAFVRLLDATGEFTAEVVTSPSGDYRFFARPGRWTVRALSWRGDGDAEVGAAQGVVTEAQISVTK